MRFLLIILLSLSCQAALALELNGRTEFSQRVSVNSSISGRVVSVDTAAGKRVTTGDVLLVLDATALQAEVDIARAGIAALEPNVEQMATELDKALELYDRDSLAQVDLAIARQNLSIAEAKLESARGHLNRALYNLSQATITAPVDGLVLAVNTYPGHYLNTQVTDHKLLTIASNRIMHARALLPLEHRNASLPGSKAQVQYGEQRFSAVVIEVGSEVTSGPNNHPSLQIVLEFTPDNALAAGLAVRISIAED